MKSAVHLVFILILVGCAGTKSNSDSETATVDTSKVSREEVIAAIREQTSAFRSCYEAYVKATGLNGKSGKFKFKWTIKADGKVAEIECDQNTFNDQDFESCMSNALSSIQYPTKKEPTLVSYPFIFQGKD